MLRLWLSNICSPFNLLVMHWNRKQLSERRLLLMYFIWVISIEYFLVIYDERTKKKKPEIEWMCIDGRVISSEWLLRIQVFKQSTNKKKIIRSKNTVFVLMTRNNNNWCSMDFWFQMSRMKEPKRPSLLPRKNLISLPA